MRAIGKGFLWLVLKVIHLILEIGGPLLVLGLVFEEPLLLYDLNMVVLIVTIAGVGSIISMWRIALAVTNSIPLQGHPHRPGGTGGMWIFGGEAFEAIAHILIGFAALLAHLGVNLPWFMPIGPWYLAIVLLSVMGAAGSLIVLQKTTQRTVGVNAIN